MRNILYTLGLLLLMTPLLVMGVYAAKMLHQFEEAKVRYESPAEWPFNQ